MVPVITGGISVSIQGEQDAGEHDTEERVPDVVGLGGHDRGDERERRAQVAGQPVAGDQQEQDRAEAGEEQGRRGREAGDQRHQEGRAEHRHHVLGAEPDHHRPAEPLVRGNHSPRFDDPVAVQLPQSHVEVPFAQSRANSSGGYLRRRRHSRR
jgi:hypothetical protein